MKGIMKQKFSLQKEKLLLQEKGWRHVTDDML